MVRNIKVGDRVRVTRGAIAEQTVRVNGVLVGHWPADAREGVVTRVQRGIKFTFIEVAADHPKAVGSVMFPPKCLERVVTPPTRAVLSK